MSVDSVYHVSDSLRKTPADVTDCLSCRESIADGALCATCADAQARILTPGQTLHELKNQLRRLFVEKMSVEAFKTRRAELLEQIATLEQAQQTPTHLIGESYYKTDLNLAIEQFTRKHGRRPTEMLIAKEDHVPADVDVTGIKVSRTGSALPGRVHLYAPKPDSPARPPRGTVTLTTTSRISPANDAVHEEVIKIDATKPSRRKSPSKAQHVVLVRMTESKLPYQIEVLKQKTGTRSGTLISFVKIFDKVHAATFRALLKNGWIAEVERPAPHKDVVNMTLYAITEAGRKAVQS
jgi:hypothetical protein